MKSSRALEDALNYRFMYFVTFRLGAYGVLLFMLWYFLELLLLLLNPVDVRSPSESIYLMAQNMLDDSAADLSRTYKPAAWLQDRKKMQAYAILSFWLATFGYVITGDRQIRFAIGQGRARLAAVIRNALPFWVNVVIALVLLGLLGGAATGLPGASGSDSRTALWRFFIWSTPPTGGNWGFLLYRLAYPALLFVCLLHFTIGAGGLLRVQLKDDQTQSLRQSAKFALVLVAFVATFVIVEVLVWSLTMGTWDLKRLAGNSGPFCLMGALILLALFVFWKAHHAPLEALNGVKQRADFPDIKDDDDLRKYGIRFAAWLFGSLPAYTVFSLFFLLIPLASYTYVAATTADSFKRNAAFGGWFSALRDERVHDYVSWLNDRVNNAGPKLFETIYASDRVHRRSALDKIAASSKPYRLLTLNEILASFEHVNQSIPDDGATVHKRLDGSARP